MFNEFKFQGLAEKLDFCPEIDRNLDTKIAQALGYDVRVCEYDSIYTYEQEWIYKGDSYIFQERSGYQSEHYIPGYSSDLESAWLLVEKIRKMNLMIRIQGWTKGGCLQGYTAEVLTCSGEHISIAVESSAPLAITEAILRALSEK